MKSIILLKEGNYTVNGFVDVMATFNNHAGKHGIETIRYYTSSSVALHLHKNKSDRQTDCQLALAHCMVDSNFPPEDANYFRPIDFNLMKEAADKHGIALFGLITSKESLPDFNLIGDGIFMVRDENDHIINYETKERICIDKPHINAITFFGLSRLENLPVYYLISDPQVVKIGDGYDFVDKTTDTVFRQITDHDGTLTEAIFTPTINEDCIMVNDTIFVKTSDLAIDLFGHPYNVLNINDMTPNINDINIDIDSNFDFDIRDNKIHFNIDNEIGYIKIKPKLGHFCDNAYQETPEFKFIIHQL